MPVSTSQTAEVLSVSELNRQAKQLLEQHFSLLTVSGEISNLSRPSSGHWYFTLKDERAQIRCAMFRNRNIHCRIKPENGQQVQLQAKLSLYEARGDYQLIVEQLQDAGAGALAQAFEKLKIRLQAEGLFEPARKQPLPASIKHIAVITSATGAAIRDVLSVLQRRAPDLQISILPVAVQGEQAATQISTAIEQANRWQQQDKTDFDLILLCRGGGSLEDLWPFNEEAVARAIVASRLPVVSAIGHEVDFSISDFVADLRAPTPSAAAELISQDRSQQLIRLQRLQQQLVQSWQSQIKHWRQQLQTLRAGLRHPGSKLQEQSQRLDDLEIRLTQAWRYSWRQQQQHWQQLDRGLSRLNPQLQIEDYQQRLQRQIKQLGDSLALQLERRQHRLQRSISVLDSLSPLRTLARGYAIVRGPRNEIVRQVEQLEIGDSITATVASGRIQATVAGLDTDHSDDQ